MTRSVLFVCNMNSVRSPMAAAILADLARDTGLTVDSAGVYEGGLDPFVEAVMQDIGLTLDAHEPKALASIDLDKIDVLVALTPEAAAEARRYMPREKIEFWPIENPSETRGGRDELLAAYRRVRDEIAARIARRFPEVGKNT